MIALLIFLLRLLVLPSKPKRGLEAENAALRRQLAILQRKVRGRVRLTNSDRLFFVLLSVVPIDPEDDDDHPAGDAGPLASGGFSSLLALEVEKPGWPATDHRRVADLDLAYEPRERAVGCTAHSWRVAQARLRGGAVDGGQAHGQEGDDPPAGQSGARFFTIICRTSLPSICSSSQPLAFVYSTPSSLFGWLRISAPSGGSASTT
jgi:hypothetical protein